MSEEPTSDEAGTVTTRAPEEQPVAAQPYSRDDFRLRLDSPLFKRDERLERGRPSVLNELTWRSVTESAEHAAAALAPAAEPQPDETEIEPESVVEIEPESVVATATEPGPVVEIEVEPAPEVVTETAPEPVAEAEPEPVVVQSEADLFALLPEVEFDESVPVELPTIRVGESDYSTPVVVAAAPAPAVAVSNLPRLSESPVFSPKAAAVPSRPSGLMEELRPTAAPTLPKQRHGFRRFVVFLFIVALLGGGAYAGKKYVLDKLHWQQGVEPLADQVASIRGLDFTAAVPVDELPAATYAARLASTLLGLDPAAEPARASEWRAFGLLQGRLDLAAIGAAATPDAPAFYDPTTKHVVVQADLPDAVHRFAVERALANALLDQHVGWSKTLVGDASAAAIAARALADGQALHVAWAAVPAADRAALQTALLALRPADAAATPSPWATAMVGRVGLAMADRYQAQPSSAMSTDAKVHPATDRGVFDIDHSLETALSFVIADDAHTRGMMFWYYAFASRLGSTESWLAALQWAGDSVVPSPETGAGCVAADIAADDAAGGELLHATLDRWAAAAPGTPATVTVVSPTLLHVVACDPGEGATTITSAPVSLGGAVLEAGVVATAAQLLPALTTPGMRCFVGAVRLKGGTFTSPADDASLIDAPAAATSPYLAATTPSASDIATCNAVG